ncbi:SDR family oxidoreductase [Neomegalonema perideroedes]|uniref:SDR family oxidoreductase n=1 Tax=Neomegalonema perideroedes TaxID=217219 RepID=UPI00039EFDA9|nr:SDR family oxidoreductase [Neomegalonema perideroedes]
MARAVVLGAYGLIGAACLRALREAGFSVTGVGRSEAAARRADPLGAQAGSWVFLDIAKTSAARWREVLAEADVAVNAAGALQDGARDDLTAIHETAVGEILKALEGTRTRFIQISAAGVSETAPTEFFRSKARGDRLVAGSGADWVILRPTLVIGAQAYGGTALLRAAAAFPLGYPRVLPEARIQTVWVEDLAQAMVQAARGEIPVWTIAEITEPEARSFAETTRIFRRWLGLPDWRRELPVPRPLLRLASRGADLLGWLGWRSPLRRNALLSLEQGVTGSPQAWEKAGGAPCRSLEATLARMPATLQEVWFARLYGLFPVVVGVLAGFWIFSGAMGILSFGAAREVLTSRGMGAGWAGLAVGAGSLADLALGLAILRRPWARAACFGMIAVSLAYLLGATLFAPGLWADPLGPLTKVFPSMILALIAAALLEER